jgi:hypothetical protein
MLKKRSNKRQGEARELLKQQQGQDVLHLQKFLRWKRMQQQNIQNMVLVHP